jgi:hypothetical protein
VYVAIARLRDAAAHRAYNAYHQLDHQPEYRALDGVVHADRWVRAPDCATYHRTPSFLDELQYFNMQWLAAPVDRSIANYSELAEQLLISGRRSDIGLLERLFLGYFRAIKGYVSPRLTVSPGALVFRPNRGLFVSMLQLAEPGTLAADVTSLTAIARCCPQCCRSPASQAGGRSRAIPP